MTARAQVDHLVVMATTLAQGVQWCEATLGVTPGPGGQHALMGTHNRLFKIASSRHPQAYFEIIAIDPQAPPPDRARWFDMDNQALQQSIAAHGPRLIHFVASVPDADTAVRSLHALGIERGAVLQASRPTANGLLQWRISVRDDGQRLFDGCLPTLIQWGQTHPMHGMVDSGVTLEELMVTHPQARELGSAYQAIDLDNVSLCMGPTRLCARLRTPAGLAELHS
jgi:hypothetical protein